VHIVPLSSHSFTCFGIANRIRAAVMLRVARCRRRGLWLSSVCAEWMKDSELQYYLESIHSSAEENVCSVEALARRSFVMFETDNRDESVPEQASGSQALTYSCPLCGHVRAGLGVLQCCHRLL